MDQLRNYADDRLHSGCIYCGKLAETREHVPSRVFLDKPYPDNLPVIGACERCNNGFSGDEQYVACAVEVAHAGTTDPNRMRRPSVASALRRSEALRLRLNEVKAVEGGPTTFNIEHERVERIAVKLARGHAAFELSQACRQPPSSIWWRPLNRLTPEELENFDSIHVLGPLGEIGSRGSQRTMVAQMTLEAASGERLSWALAFNDWIDVQEGRYRYLAINDPDEIRIKMIIGEYLACEVTWPTREK